MGVRSKPELCAQGSQLCELPLDVPPLLLQSRPGGVEPLLERHRISPFGTDDLGQQRRDHAGAEPGREQVLDPDDPVDIVGLVEPLVRLAAARMQQALLLVIAQGAVADAGGLRQLPDPHRR